MKICMLAPEFLPVWGGVGTYIVELVRHMPKNVEIHVVTPFRESIGKYKVSSNEYDFSRFFRSNVYIHFVSKATDTFFYNAVFQYAVARYVPKLVKNEKIDVIHSHTAHMPDFLLSYRNCKIPIITTVHTTIKGQRRGTNSSGMNFFGMDLSEKMTLLAYPLLSLAEYFYFMRNRCYITVSSWMKNQLLKYYPGLRGQKIHVIHNAVDTSFFSPALSECENRAVKEKNVVLFTGRLTAAKGVNLLIEAIPKMLKKCDDILFMFIGPGDPSPYLRRLEKEGVPKFNYKFLGYMKQREELLFYYRMADVFVAPTFYENLPIRVLEAMACGLPVVAANVCAIPEAIENDVDGILIPPGSVDELANAVLHVLENNDLRKKMGKNARNKVVREFSWTVAAQKTIKVYEHALGCVGL